MFGLSRRRVMFAVCTAGLLIPGCGVREYRRPETGASLEGTVKYAGKTVPAAMIIVAGESGGATGNIGEGGRYHVENVPVGEVKVAVNTDAAKGQMMGQKMAQAYQGGKGGAKPAPIQFLEVPKKYQDPNSSGITTTIKSGANTFEIVLQ
jgi:hypothetical protein